MFNFSTVQFDPGPEDLAGQNPRSIPGSGWSVGEVDSVGGPLAARHFALGTPGTLEGRASAWRHLREDLLALLESGGGAGT
jgi:hypothetical protein